MPIPRFMRHAAVVALLAMSLLFAQMLGFVHGIAHAGWPEGAIHSLIDAALFDGDGAPSSVASAAGKHPPDAHSHDTHHSCAAYDAAALSAGLHTDFPPLPQLPPVRVLALWQAFVSWDAPLNCHFFSRAPPR